MVRLRRSIRLLAVLASMAACGCGDDTNDGPDPTAGELRPLAYVLTECSADAERETSSQRLVVRQPGGDEITIKHFVGPGSPTTGLCQLFGEAGLGFVSKIVLPFQRLGVSPDGETVVFEVTEEHSLLAGLGDFVPDEEEGIFVVGSDGTGLRRLGPASRNASFRVSLDPTGPGGLAVTAGNRGFSFSPNGRKIAFTDLGRGPSDEEAVQIVTIDLSDGERTQVTRLPRFEPVRPAERTIQGGSFVDDTKIQFIIVSAAVLAQLATVSTDGSGELTIVESPKPLPGATIIPEFSITGEDTQVFPFALEGTPVNPERFFGRIIELFVFDGTNLLQLTNFRRADTALNGNRLLSRDGRRAFFSASANPLGTNPHENCQYFSVDVVGGDVRQLTNFGGDETSLTGCEGNPVSGCSMFMLGNERETDTAVFYSTCDPLGTNPSGGQIFRIQLDGSGLRQLTTARGMENPAPGTVTVELPGPIAYPEFTR